jgi:hypothetical protein
MRQTIERRVCARRPLTTGNVTLRSMPAVGVHKVAKLRGIEAIERQ